MAPPFLTIPTELVCDIAEYLPPHDAIALLTTCRGMAALHAFLLSRYKNSMLLFAAKHNRLALLRTALSAGADIAYTLPSHRPTFQGNRNGHDTPLHHAAANGNTAIIAELLRHNPPLEHHGDRKRTPLLVATAHGHQAAVDMLLAAGCNPDARDRSSVSTLLVLAIESNLTPTAIAFIHQMDAFALEHAIRHQRLSIVQLMFARGIAATVVPPLQFAACSGSGLPYVQLCIEHGALADIDARDAWNMNALSLAAFRGDAAVVRYLLAQGADVNAGAPRNTPIMSAVLQSRTEIVEILLRHGADLRGLRSREANVLRTACSSGPVELVRMLLDAVDSSVPSDKCLVYTARVNSQVDVVELLLERGYCRLETGPLRSLRRVNYRC